jgi:hypothetical protein
VNSTSNVHLLSLISQHDAFTLSFFFPTLLTLYPTFGKPALIHYSEHSNESNPDAHYKIAPLSIVSDPFLIFVFHPLPLYESLGFHETIE